MHHFLPTILLPSYLSANLSTCSFSEATKTLSEVLTVLQLVLDGSFEVESFNQGRLMQNQRVAHTVDVDSLRRDSDAQL